jgi:hypothetical protein
MTHLAEGLYFNALLTLKVNNDSNNNSNNNNNKFIIKEGWFGVEGLPMVCKFVL